MYCPKCGAQVAEGTSFCSSCGTNLAQPPPVYPNYPPSGSTPYNPAYYQQKSGALAVVLAFIIPGAGHLYAGKIIRGIVFMVAFYGLTIVTVVGMWSLLVSGTIVIGLFWFPVLMVIVEFVIWLFQIIDAYNVTRNYNAALLATGRAPW
jgi:TM2 domain-containing membrane protein YozV